MDFTLDNIYSRCYDVVVLIVSVRRIWMLLYIVCGIMFIAILYACDIKIVYGKHRRLRNILKYEIWTHKYREWEGFRGMWGIDKHISSYKSGNWEVKKSDLGEGYEYEILYNDENVYQKYAKRVYKYVVKLHADNIRACKNSVEQKILEGLY